MTTVAEINHAKIESTLNVTLVDPLRDSEWDSLLAGFPEATAFHTSAWARVLCRTYGHKPFYLRFDHSGELVGLVPLMEVRSALTGVRGVCLPFTDFCTPLISGPRFANAVTKHVLATAKNCGWKHVELRDDGGGYFAEATAAATYYAHDLILTSEEEVWKKMLGSSRTAVRKARREGISITICNSRQSVEEFYRLHAETRRRHGVPPQPYRFFANIYREIIGARHGFVVLANAGAQCIAAAIFFEFNAMAIYKFSATDARAQHLCPTNLAIWEAICALLESGCKVLHFGRTDLANEGLRRFKLAWGTTEHRLGYLQLGKILRSDSPPNQSHTLARAFLRRMPLSINRLAGAIVYPHLD
jgi:CelD/BcsL family acetyltransferase involved in cellulose biosynthesis